MARFFKAPRLLPIVMVVGAPLLALKGAGLVHDAQAAEAAAPQATMQDFQTQPSTTDDDSPVTNSAAEVGVLSGLAKRRTQLDDQQQSIAMRESLLEATEKRIDDKIAMLKQLQAQIQQLLAQRDGEQEKQVASLVKTYSSMKPKDAARIFNTLDDSVLVPVAQEMKPDVLGPILANMQAAQAQKLTVELADRLHVPDPQVTAPASAPPAPQAQAAPSIDPSALAAALAPEAPLGSAPATPAGASSPTPAPQTTQTPAAQAAAQPPAGKPAPGPQAQAPQSAPPVPAAKGG